jgi:hypothetical protein
VPRSWPVVNDTRRRTTCVRFDRHAIYLGTVSREEFCPSWLLGTTESMLIEPGPAGARPAAGLDPVARRMTVRAPRIVIVATFDRAPGIIERILAEARLPEPAPARAEPAARAAFAWPAHRRRAARAEPAARAARAWPAHRRRAGRRQPMRGPYLPPTVASYHGLGFDACTAPSQRYMNAWLRGSPYRVIGIYIGGADRACAQPNLTQTWVRAQAAAGWRFIPLYAGPQAAFGELGAPARQAGAAAFNAVDQARLLGFGPGTPIYYDMEAYAPRQRAAALTFLSVWSFQVRRLGYLAGVYSSSDSGVTDLVKNYGGHRFATPDIIYDALWNGAATTSDPNIPAALWANHRRIHQFRGNVTQRHGGLRINIDQDFVDVRVRDTALTPQASAAVSLPGGLVEVFYRDARRQIWLDRYLPGAGWSGPVRTSARSSSAPSVVWTGRVVDVFYRGPGGFLWVDARRLRGGLVARRRLTMMGALGWGPLAVTQPRGVIDVFWRGSADDHLWHGQYSPQAGWQGPQGLGGNLASAPSPVVSSAGQTAVFWRGTDGSLWTVRRGLTGRWSVPTRLGMGPLGGRPVATAQPSGAVEVYWLGWRNSRLWEAFYQPGRGWRGPRDLGGDLRSAPWPATAGGGVRVFWLGPGGTLYVRAHRPGHGWNLPGWRGQFRLRRGRATGGPFAAAGRQADGLRLFWLDRPGQLWTSALTSGGWVRPRRLAGALLR